MEKSTYRFMCTYSRLPRLSQDSLSAIHWQNQPQAFVRQSERSSCDWVKAEPLMRVK